MLVNQISTGDVLLIGISLGVANLGFRGVPRNVRVELAVGVLTANTFFLTGLIGVFISAKFSPALLSTSSGNTELRSSSRFSRCS